MNNKFRNFLVGIGSALAIMPAGSVAQVRLSDQSDADKLRSDWDRVGQHLYSAMGQVDNEQKKQISG